MFVAVRADVCDRWTAACVCDLIGFRLEFWIQNRIDETKKKTAKKNQENKELGPNLSKQTKPENVEAKSGWPKSMSTKMPYFAFEMAICGIRQSRCDEDEDPVEIGGASARDAVGQWAVEIAIQTAQL